MARNPWHIAAWLASMVVCVACLFDRLEDDEAAVSNGAKQFLLNSDFGNPGLAGSVSFIDFTMALNEQSANKASAMAINDKLTVSAFIDRMNETLDDKILQMDVLLWGRMEGETMYMSSENEIEDFVRNGNYDWVLKPTHLYSNQGVVAMNREKWRTEQWSKEKLLQVMTQTLQMRADGGQSAAVQAAMPGVVVQRKFPAPPEGALGHVASQIKLLDKSPNDWRTEVLDIFNVSTGTWKLQEGAFPKMTCPKLAESLFCGVPLSGKKEQINLNATLKDTLRTRAPQERCTATAQCYSKTFSSRPLELRIPVVWGKAYMGVVLHPVSFYNHMFINRKGEGWEAKSYPINVRTLSKLTAGVEFDVVLTSDDREALASHLQVYMQDAAEQAERIAKFLGVPWLRVDFFIPPDRTQTLTLNEVELDSQIPYLNFTHADEFKSVNELGRLKLPGSIQTKLRKLMDAGEERVITAFLSGWDERDQTSETFTFSQLWGRMGCSMAGGGNQEGVDAYKKLRCFKPPNQRAY